MSAPLMVSMFVMALYNIVDSIFLGMYSTDALTAVSYCFPFQNLNAAFGIGTAVGMSALLSRYLGAKEYDKADKVAHNGFVLIAINYTIFFLLGCFAPQIMALMTSDNTNAQIICRRNHISQDNPVAVICTDDPVDVRKTSAGYRQDKVHILYAAFRNTVQCGCGSNPDIRSSGIAEAGNEGRGSGDRIRSDTRMHPRAPFQQEFQQGSRSVRQRSDLTGRQ